MLPPPDLQPIDISVTGVHSDSPLQVDGSFELGLTFEESDKIWKIPTILCPEWQGDIR